MLLLNNKFRKFLLITFIYAFYGYNNNSLVCSQSNTVKHKDSQLNRYLDAINQNTNAYKKVGILPYILLKPDGTYLEIGTGSGGPVALMLEKIPMTANTVVIASDIDENILNALLIRYPALNRHINAETGPCLRLQQLNAIDMSVFEDGELDGINASSLVHEIFSYAGGFTAIDKFFCEAYRVLKHNGILVYVDPESLSDKKKIVSVQLKNKLSRLFAHIYLYKILDTNYSCLANKSLLYVPDDVKFSIYKKNELVPGLLTYQEYLNIPSWEIDFSKDYTITLPCGLYHELACHYITYSLDCNPLCFVNCIPEKDYGLYSLKHLSQSSTNTFDTFLNKEGYTLHEGKINQIIKNALDKEIDTNAQVLEFGLSLRFTSKDKQAQLLTLLKEQSLDPNKYITMLSDRTLLLDYRIFGLLYDKINSLFDENNGAIEQKNLSHAQWLKREAEEFYCYYGADELIARVLSITLDLAKTDENEPAVLCPLSAEVNRFADRPSYAEFLNEALEVQDMFGYNIPIKIGGREIHFAKISLSNALAICENIIKENPLEYPCVAAWLKRTKEQLSGTHNILFHFKSQSVKPGISCITS